MQPEIPLSLYYQFLALTIFAVTIIVLKLHRTFQGNRTIISGFILWFFIQYAAGKLGFFAIGLGEIPPKIMIVVVPNFLFIFYLWFSKKGEEVAGKFDLTFLTAFQSFRIFVEIILWQLAGQKLLPEVMSFEGRNFDVLTGLTAPLIAFLYWKGKLGTRTMIIWNIAGLILVTNVVVHGILAVPGIQLITTNIPNFIISYAPFNLLPGVLVPIAYFGHVLSLKKLLKKGS